MCMQVLYAGIDATSIEHAPIRDHAPARSLLFVVWMLLAGFMLLDLFIGSLVDAYNEIQAEEDGTALLTEGQKRWTIAMEHLVSLQPRRFARRPTNPCRAWCFDMCRHPRFDTAILIVIVFNTALMAADGYGTSERYAPTLSSRHTSHRPMY